jgi:hypothetical protein
MRRKLRGLAEGVDGFGICSSFAIEEAEIASQLGSLGEIFCTPCELIDCLLKLSGVVGIDSGLKQQV